MKYSNFLQELTFLRPTGMLSPKAFQSEAADAYTTHNSCPVRFGDVGPTKAPTSTTTITCAGIKAPIGTGPFKYVSRTQNASGDIWSETDFEVVFNRNELYWGGSPDIEVLKVKYFATADEVATALNDGTIDAVLGDGVLAPAALRSFQASSDFLTYSTPVYAHSMIIINSGKTPTDDIDLRKTIIHGVNKVEIIDDVMSGVGEVVDRMFPRATPYSDVELTPRYDYDLEKAQLLNCETGVASLPTAPHSAPSLDVCSQINLPTPPPTPSDPGDTIKAAVESATSVLALAACAVAALF